MNSSEQKCYRALIETRLAGLDTEDRLGASGAAVVELDQQAIGRLSRMDALQNQAMAKAGATRRRNERQRLVAALARIDAGDYGLCEECGDDIVPARLDLDPAAGKCISCARG